MRSNQSILTALLCASLILPVSALAADGDVMIEQSGNPAPASGFNFQAGKLSLGIPNSERTVNIVSDSALVNLIRVHPDFGSGFLLRWKKSAGAADSAHWIVGVDQMVGSGGFSIIDRLNADARRLSIHQNGNVGIGTTNPTEKLAVNGAIRAKSVVVDSGWADYVFESDHELMTLESTKEYIREHKRLPGFPSASEVSSKGVDLAQANVMLLAKVEELTLHLIALNERIQELERNTIANTNRDTPRP